MSDTRHIEKLSGNHKVEGFDCGRAELNTYLSKYALQNQLAGTSQTYVGLVGDVIVGFYALAVGAVTHEQTPPRIIKGVPKYHVPIMLLARLAVDNQWKKQGIGKALLKDAMLRTLQAADIAGIRAFVVHAKDEEARRFYQYFDFIPSPTDPLHLFLLLKNLRRITG